MTEYVVTIFANEKHANVTCPMDGREICRRPSRDSAERFIAKLAPRMAFHTAEITAIVKEHTPGCVYAQWLAAGRAGKLGPDSGQSIPACTCES